MQLDYVGTILQNFLQCHEYLLLTQLSHCNQQAANSTVAVQNQIKTGINFHSIETEPVLANIHICGQKNDACIRSTINLKEKTSMLTRSSLHHIAAK